MGPVKKIAYKMVEPKQTAVGRLQPATISGVLAIVGNCKRFFHFFRGYVGGFDSRSLLKVRNDYKLRFFVHLDLLKSNLNNLGRE